jgi:predicted branched-subunit amino acid permease
MSTIIDDRPSAPPAPAPAREIPALWAPPAPAVRRPTPSPVRAGIRAGIHDIAPVLVALAPFAAVLGVAIDRSIVGDLIGVVMAPVVYAGAANLAALSVLDAGGAALAAVGTALVINARFAMYGAAIAGRFRDQPTWFRLLGPWIIVDQNFALAMARDETDPRWFRAYWLSSGALLGAGYTALIVVGVVLGAVVPSGAGLELTVPAMFLAMAIGQLKDRPSVVAALVGATVTAVALELPYGIGLLAGALAGVVAGTIARRTS